MAIKVPKVIDNVAGAVAQAGKNANDAINQKLDDDARKKNPPLYIEKFFDRDYKRPKIIALVSRDDFKKEKHLVEALGIVKKVESNRVLYLFRSEIRKTKLSFIPNAKGSIYYEHPHKKGVYVNAEDYFVIINDARVVELKEIARSLGAVKIKIQSVESTQNVEEKNVNGIFKFKKDQHGNANFSKNAKKVNEKRVSILDTTTWQTSTEPKCPQLNFFKHDDHVVYLVNNICAGDRVKHDAHTIKYSSSVGMSLSAASAIDAVAEEMKFELKINVKNEVKKQNDFEFSYEIDF